jgi:hypothetical protein
VVVVVAASLFLGALLVVRESIALALALALFFVIVWRMGRWMVLLPPLFWMLVGDPALLRVAGIGSSRLYYIAMDAWTLFAIIALALGILSNRESARRLFASPLPYGVLALWTAVFLSQAIGGGSGQPFSVVWAEGRGIFYAAWIPISAFVLADERPRRSLLLAELLLFGVLGKGILFYAAGIGLQAADYVAGYRAYGSEEATVGLVALCIGLSVMGNSAVRRTVPLVLVASGGAILALGALRAHWLAAAAAVALVLAIQLVRSPTRSVRTAAWIAAAVGAGWVALMTVARHFYEVSIAKRLATVLGGVAAARSDISLGYRFVELGTVAQAVGSRWVFGGGLGAQHRGVYIWDPQDVFLQTILPGYVHNSFAWGYLKAGAVGVVAVVGYYASLIAEPVRAFRASRSALVQDVAVGLAVSGVMAPVVALFNALVASPRHQIVFAIVYGAFFAWRTNAHE